MTIKALLAGLALAAMASAVQAQQAPAQNAAGAQPAQGQNAAEAQDPAQLRQAALGLGDPAAGETVFRRCQACHAVGEGAENKVGPELNGVVGRVPGTLESYNYSNAMKSFGETNVWDAETLHAFLSNPRKVVQGTKMAFPGLRKEEELNNIIAYLAQFDETGAQTQAAQ